MLSTCALLERGQISKKNDTENLIPGIKGDQVSKIAVFGHFLGNQSLKVPNFLHDGRRQ